MDFSQDEPREYGGSAPFPDLMNDPAYATNIDIDGKEKGFEDPDTCRICRGEGSEEEQLFYPCKCSGSIKFVHQSCLVEWLSHSQKKYCELCKTPFRFTKLYDPNMPRDLPAPLFMRQLAVHSLRTVVTWLRFGLVAFVWLGWLPWSMRAIWRALFWLADGRWPGGDSSQARAGSSNITVTGTAVASTSLTATQSMQTDAPPVQSPMSSMFSYSAGEPLMLTFMKKALSTLFFPTISSNTGSANSTVATASYKQRHPSWLSDVKFLNSLTPSPTINNIIIDTLEGQLITLLVVISFILIFLIREWVVQQQPMANIADGEREAAVQLIANNRPAQEAHQPQPEPILQPQNEFHHDEAEEHIEHISDHEEEDELRSIHESLSSRDEDPITSEGASASVDIPRPSGGESSTRANQVWPGIDPFRDLWERSNGNPDLVLKIVEEEGREEELEWIVTLMRRLQQHHPSPSSAGHDRPFNATDSDLSGSTAADAERGLPTLSESLQASSMNDPASDSFAGIGSSQDIAPPFSPRFGDDSGSPSQHAFTFDFREPDVGTAGIARNDPGTRLGGATGPNEVQEQDPTNAPAAEGENAESGSSGRHQQPSENEQPARRAPQNLTERVLDWFWADIIPDDQAQERSQQDDEHIVEDPALEAPFIPIQNNRRLANDGAQDDQDMAAAAGEADVDANDVDAIEEADDLEGILELIGMQGPIFGLLQNGVFSALLISFTVALGIWLPYLWGKIALVLLANPIDLIFRVPMTTVSIIADITLDTLIGSLGYVMYSVSIICKVLLSPFGAFVPLGTWVPRTKSVTSASLSLIDASSHRLRKVVNAFFVFHESDVPMFSVISHQALKLHQARIVGICRAIFDICKFTLYDLPIRIISLDLNAVLSSDYKAMDFSSILSQAREKLYALIELPYLALSSAKWVNAGLAKTATFNISNNYYDLAVWDTKDRVIAIIMGYVLASVLGLLYLRITGILSGVNHGQRIEGLVADVLHQAGGVMKVILIIGIEMIVFPLYCGSLLDVALLPLFENATISSRLEFTSTSPTTSLFVHWFIGTCYMFHFALFVSMCRKIMRSGVLYFIRDPDDPTFHPVRDVLERNITTQLRKIAFSAMVYGALVIVCLGGVVWGIYYAFDGVLPVHWSATVPVLEFPVDLLFYNFVMPLAIRSIKPSDGLHNLYDWWFHKCARFLRLTNFFFGDRRLDEEGQHVRRTWWDALSMKKGDVEHPVVSEAQHARAEGEPDVYFLRDGRFVRAPASDQVRIPKGSQVFLEVTEDNKRVDGAPDSDYGLHGWNSDMFTKVYIPSFFRVRIAAFILSIWAFASVTGVGITIIPLLTGRKMLSSWFPNRTPPNDIYAFSSGICVVGCAACAVWYCRASLAALKNYLRPYLRSPREACLGLFNAVISALSLLYVLTAFSVVVPSLVGLVLELYVLVPLHTYFGGTEAHVIHFVQDWTLGVLYVQMAIKFMMSNSTTRPAVAFKGIFRDNWLKPNVRLATRALLLPITLAATITVVVPLVLGFVLNSTTVFGSSPEVQSKVYRYAYPLTLLLSVVMWVAYLVRRQVEIWRVSVRDDVYLIGERLHNFSDKRGKDAGVSQRESTR